MKLNDRAYSILQWAHDAGIVPIKFYTNDKFVTIDREIIELLQVTTKDVLWLPTLGKLREILEESEGMRIAQTEVDGSLIMLSSDFQGKKVEGAGSSIQDAVISYLEGLKDAYQQRSTVSD